ncbi:MAG: alpha-amylase family glycosyl hydrolase [Gemmatimonadota bacterium]
MIEAGFADPTKQSIDLVRPRDMPNVSCVLPLPARALLAALLLAATGCQPAGPADPPPAPAAVAASDSVAAADSVGASGSVALPEAVPFWENATIYFLLTDRFHNGDPTNDVALGRDGDHAVLRGFMGGDLAGITQKIEEGYFDSLGVNAIWLTPFVEQIRGKTDEGTGDTYAYHGYWAADWTRIDPNFGTEEDLRRLVDVAHDHGIRLVMDVVINHTGPVTPLDPQWPDDWVRTDPSCTYQGYETTVECTLVDNLPDIRTESLEPVDLPPSLMEKWAAEGRLEQEMAELDAFFDRTGWPRAPRYYLIKWLTDWVREFGIDGYRGDTAKHVEPEVWTELKQEAVAALREWKDANPEEKIDDRDFFMMGEVYGYGIGGGRAYDFGDRAVDFYDHGFESLINFAFKADAEKDPHNLFQDYSYQLNQGPLDGVGVLNYVSSHDDGAPFDRERRRAMEAGTKLLLAPGAVQVYYGDETARPLEVPGAVGDANLRSFMNWDDVERNTRVDGRRTREILEHWRKLGRFRRAHPAVGAGVHERLQQQPLVFSRTLEVEGYTDRVLVLLDGEPGAKTLPVRGLFDDGTELLDYYSGQRVRVEGARVVVDSPHRIVLLGKERGG